MSARASSLILLAPVVLLTSGGSSPADTPSAGTVLLGSGGTTEYVVGDLPIIIAAPHGGTTEPRGLPDRIAPTGGRYDTNSLELARSIHDAFRSRLGKTPHLILMHVHRKKVDVNRDVVEGSQGEPGAERIWEDFHGFIDLAGRRVTEQFGAGLFIDLHGHRHPRQRVELGYLLVTADLSLSDDSLDSPAVFRRSSIRAMMESSPFPFSALLRGPQSLGALYEAQGYSTVPSPSVPEPAGEWYFSGGYNTERHGSRDSGAISGIQLETPWTRVRETEASRKAFAERTVNVLTQYMKLHFHYPGL